MITTDIICDQCGKRHKWTDRITQMVESCRLEIPQIERPDITEPGEAVTLLRWDFCDQACLEAWLKDNHHP